MRRKATVFCSQSWSSSSSTQLSPFDRTDAISCLRLPDWMVWCNCDGSSPLALPAHTCSLCVLLWRSFLDSSRFFVPNRKATRSASNILSASLSLSLPMPKELSSYVTNHRRLYSNHQSRISGKLPPNPSGFSSPTARPLESASRLHSHPRLKDQWR